MVTARFTSFHWPVRLGAAACALMVLCAAAQAQRVRFVSALGDDANACTQGAPCLTLQRGVDVTPNGGEVQILTSGLYSDVPVVIDKSITISATGVSATVRGVRIEGAGAAVALRGLLLNGVVAGRDIRIGVDVVLGAAYIIRCEIERFLDYGIRQDSAAGLVFIADSIVRDGRNQGIRATSRTGPVVIDNSRFENNRREAMDLYNADVTIKRSVASGNGSGILVHQGARVLAVETTSTHNASGPGFGLSRGSLTLESSTASQNATGLDVTGGLARISNSTFADNTNFGIRNLSRVLTRQSNTISGNGTNLAGNALIPIAAK